MNPNEKLVTEIIENSEPSGEVVYPENKNIFLFTRKVRMLEIEDMGGVKEHCEKILQ